MKKFEKAFAISVLSGVSLLVPKNGDEAYAMFGKKPPTPAQSTTSTTMGPPSKTMAKPGGISVGKIKSVIQDSPKSIDKRNNLLSQIKEGFNSTGGKELLPIESILSLLHHEPDKYKRNSDKGVRSHTHIDLSNDIKVKLDVGIESGKLKSVVIKTSNKKLVVDAETGNRTITEFASKSKSESGGASSVQPKTSDDKSKDVRPKTQQTSTGKSEGAVGTSIQSKTSGDKIEDVRPKTQQTSVSKSSGAVGGAVPKQKLGVTQPKKISEYIIEEGTSNINNKKFIEKVYSSSGRDVKLLKDTLKEYSGNGPIEDGIYKITYKNDKVEIKVNHSGEIESVRATKGGKVVEQEYIKSSDKSFEEIQKHAESVIKKVYESRGLDEKVLEEAVKNHGGEVERTLTENIHKFVSGENVLNIHTDSDKKLSHMSLKYKGEFLQRSYPIDESEFLIKSESSYKLGFFKVPESDLYVQKQVFQGTDSRGNKQFFTKNNEGGVDIVVETKEGFFSKVMSSEQQKLFESIQTTDTLIVKNRDGSDKRVLVERIDVNGIEMTVAHQKDDGLWRVVEKNQDGTLYLGSVVRYENLPKNIQGKLRAAVKAYEGYGKLLTGIKDIIK